ncbi:MAG: PilZ domain-containing protein [Bacillota bacterium]
MSANNYSIGNMQTRDEYTGRITTPEPLYENVWGNDYTILDKLDERQLADRRLYVRVRHIQRIECYTISDSMEEEPVLLAHPIVFTISDLSMGGIGIICDSEISVGKILTFQIILDGIPYKIKCEVVYCIRNDNKFRAGLKIVQKDKKFIMHLKIYVARISLNSRYGSQSIQAI